MKLKSDPDFYQGHLNGSWQLSVDIANALRSAPLHVTDPHPVRDALIAATALMHAMTVVTRNAADFMHTGAAVLNPWEIGI